MLFSKYENRRDEKSRLYQFENGIAISIHENMGGLKIYYRPPDQKFEKFLITRREASKILREARKDSRQ
jgi:hypothetical protein